MNLENNDKQQLKKSFLNFVLTQFQTYLQVEQNNYQEIPLKKKKQGSKQLYSILDTKTDPKSDEVKFKYFLIFELPKQILLSTIKNKNEYLLKLLPELINFAYNHRIINCNNNNNVTKITKKQYFSKVYKNKKEHNYPYIIGKQIAKLQNDNNISYPGIKYLKQKYKQKGEELIIQINNLECKNDQKEYVINKLK